MMSIRMTGRGVRGQIGFALSAVGVLLLVPTIAYPVTFTSNTTINAENTTYDGQDIVVEGCTLTANGQHTFNSLTVQRNAGNQPGVVTHGAAFSGSGVSGFNPTIATGVFVRGGGSLVSSRVDVSRRAYFYLRICDVFPGVSG